MNPQLLLGYNFVIDFWNNLVLSTQNGITVLPGKC